MQTFDAQDFLYDQIKYQSAIRPNTPTKSAALNPLSLTLWAIFPYVKVLGKELAKQGRSVSFSYQWIMVVCGGMPVNG